MKRSSNVILTGMLICAAVLAVLLAGVRLIGLRPYVVISGSMEPAYRTGSLLYVKKVDCRELAAGDVITFLLDDTTVVTHRVVEVIPDAQSGELRFRTKGDANDAADASLVPGENVLGTPQFSVPELGRLVSYIQAPPGLYVTISVGAILFLLVLLPDVFAPDAGKKKKAAVSDDPPDCP